MPREIERKFLAAGDGWRADVERSQRIRQGYVFRDDRVELRVRLAEDGARLTVKSVGGGRARLEYEYDIPADEAEEMIEKLAGGRVVEKVRHRVRCGGVLWEVDEFCGRLEGLVMAEVELEDEDEDVALPGWIGREVTDDGAYRNAALATADKPPAFS